MIFIPVAFILNVLLVLTYICAGIFIYKCIELIYLFKTNFYNENIEIVKEFYHNSETFKKLYDKKMFDIKEGNWLICNLFGRERILIDIIGIDDLKEKEKIFSKISNELSKNGSDAYVEKDEE